MPQALKPLSLIHNEKGKFSQLPILALWGNKNWLPSMKVKKLKIFQNKMGLKGCKWSSLNATLCKLPIRALVLGSASRHVKEKAFNGASRGDPPVKNEEQSCDIRGYVKRGE